MEISTTITLLDDSAKNLFTLHTVKSTLITSYNHTIDIIFFLFIDNTIFLLVRIRLALGRFFFQLYICIVFRKMHVKWHGSCCWVHMGSNQKIWWSHTSLETLSSACRRIGSAGTFGRILGILYYTILY